MRPVVYYDRPSRCWWAYWRNDAGDQVADAVAAPSRDWALIYLGAQLSSVGGSAISA